MIVYSVRDAGSLSRALEFVRPNDSTDPKDKVDGLYGILDHFKVEQLPSVDYTRSVLRIYYETTRFVLQHDQNLHLMYLTGLQPDVPGLATWVPGYRNSQVIAFLDAYGYHPSAGSSADFQFGTEHNSLSLKMPAVDEICQGALSTSLCTAEFRRRFAASANFSKVGERCAAVRELIRTMQTWVRLSNTIKSYPTGETPDTAFHKVVTQPFSRTSYSRERLMDPETAKDLFEEWSSVVTADVSLDRTPFHDDISL
jgi:hypothetical protein